MKKRKWQIVFLAVLAVFVMGVGLTACSDPSAENPPRVVLDRTTAEMDVWDTLQLNASVENTDDPVQWETSDGTIASVENGLVTALAEGSATITASAGGASDSCNITVVNSYTAPVMAVSASNVSIARDESFTVIVTTTWKGEPVADTIEYEWMLADDAADDIVSATPAAHGESVTFTGLAWGETAYVVSAEYRGVELVKYVNIKVVNADLQITFADLTPVAGGYSAQVSLVEHGSDVAAVSLRNVTVTDHGETVADAADKFVYVADDPQIVSVSDETLTGLQPGETTVTGIYNDGEGTVTIHVLVYRPTIDLGKTLEFELVPGTSASQPSDFALNPQYDTADDALVGTITDVRFSDVSADVFDSLSGTVVTLDLTWFLDAGTSSLGSHELIIETDKAMYLFDAGVYTMVINSEAELMAAMAPDGVAFAIANRTQSSYYFDGYYVLGQDIVCQSPFTGLITISYLQNHRPTENGALVDWTNGSYLGFCGIFDGRGYNIDQFEMATVQGSLFGTLARDGVIRNVSFTNAKISERGALLNVGGTGKIENVFIECIALHGGTGTQNNDRTSFVFSANCWGGASVSNVFIVTVSDVAAENCYALGNSSKASFSGVYVIGMDADDLIVGATLPASAGAAYDDYNELIAAGNNFSSWQGDFWTLANGLPYPEHLLEDRTPVAVAELDLPVSVPAGDSVAFDIPVGALVMLDSGSAEAGVALICNGRGNYSLTVPEGVVSNTQITVTVADAYNPQVSHDYVLTVTVKVNEKTVTVQEQFEVDLYHNGSTLMATVPAVGSRYSEISVSSLEGLDFSFDLSDYATEIGDVSGWNVALRQGQTTVNGAVFSDGTLTVPRTALQSLFGEDVDFALVFETEDTNGYITDRITVSFQADIYTLLIQSASDLTAFMRIAYEQSADAAYWDGYFALRNDISFSSAYYGGPQAGSGSANNIVDITGVNDWANPGVNGFKGTFDGKGYNISGLRIEYYSGGSMFGTIANGGIVRNVSFTNMSLMDGSLCFSGGGAGSLIENVYLQLNSLRTRSNTNNFQAAVFHSVNCYGSGTIRNVMIQVDSFVRDDAVTTANMGSVFGKLNGTIDGVYAIGTTAAYNNNTAVDYQSVTSNSSGKKWGAFSDASEFRDYIETNGIDFSSWEGEFWALVDGIPYPVNLAS